MAKSVVAIGVIGLGGCVVLSLLLRQALEATQELRSHPLEAELEQQFARRLVGPARLAVDRIEGRRRVTVQLRVLAGLRKERIAEAAGLFVWQRMRGTDEFPDEVLVAVTDDGEGRVVQRLVPRPDHWGPAPR